MAAVMAARSSAPTPKPKRPLPPSLQTSPNGIYPTSSPSPSLASKRLPPGSQAPTSAGATSVNGLMTPNGTGPKLVRRKDSTKFGDGNKPRIGRPPLETATSSTVRPMKRPNEPFVKTTSWMLKKYRKAQPSFILHLHPQYFRFDQQDGSFSYTSPMRILLEHIKNQTVPQEILEDLHAAGIKFYECCLIVQIHDHRNATSNASSSSGTTKSDQNQPFSIHNYNQYVTPSSYVPFPTLKTNDETATNEENQSKDKQPADSNGDAVQGPRIFTTVLFPTAMTLHDDMMRIAAARETSMRKQGVPGQPPAKRQKTQMSKKTLESIEAETIMATAPPLYLEPLNNLGEMKQLYDKLSDPLCNRLPPAPKSRKRTVAELAADEALAAEQQSFMLIMDERLAPSSTAAATSKTTVADAEANSNATEARFERFKTLEEIKESLREKKERENEARIQQQAQLAAQQQQQQQAAQQAAQQQAQQQAAAQMRIKIEQERAAQEANKARELQAKKQELLRNQQAQALAQQSVQHHQPMAQSLGPNVHGHPAQSNAMLANAQAMAASQAAHSSPIVRHMTPQNAPSPAMGNMVNRPQAVPMSISGSNQGAGSPPRPGSAISHAHPGGVAMMSQRSQQPPSRNGTPAMANGTPRLHQATPIMGSVTPTPRMTQASPVGHPNATPMMANGMLGAAHMSNQPQITQQEQQRIMMQQQQQRQHAAMMQAQRERQQMHGGPQLTPQQAQMLAAQQQARAQSQNAQDVYRANLHAFQQQMQNAGGQPVMNNMMASQLQQQQQSLQQQQMRRMQLMARELYTNNINQLKIVHGGENNIPSQALEEAKQAAMRQANEAIQEQRRRALMQQQQQQQQNHALHQQNHAVHQQQQQQLQQRQAAMLAHLQRANQMNGQMNGMGGMNGM